MARKCEKIVTQTIVFTLALFCCYTPIFGATPGEIQEWLQQHNSYRELHEVPDVTWSSDLAMSAQSWADRCPSGHSASVNGENIAYATNNASISDVVGWWYNEESLYDYDNPELSFAAGHFTQVVWKNTAQIGCGIKTGCSGSWPIIWVCQYSPSGNIIGQFTDNVFPPRTTPPTPSVPSGNSMVPIYNLLLR